MKNIKPVISCIQAQIEEGLNFQETFINALEFIFENKNNCNEFCIKVPESKKEIFRKLQAKFNDVEDLDLIYANAGAGEIILQYKVIRDDKFY